jgi:hypothetical protein
MYRASPQHHNDAILHHLIFLAFFKFFAHFCITYGVIEHLSAANSITMMQICCMPTGCYSAAASHMVQLLHHCDAH